MPRNGSGTYTLPASNPVVAGTTIEASWANNTMSDIATELTNSLSRSGAGGMTGPLRLDAGTSSVPGLAWGAETTTGWYRAGTGDIRFAVATVDVLRVQSTGLTLTGALSVSGTTTLTGAATLTANPTLSAGTANGVLFLDGSKVASSGSAFQYNGSTLTLFSNVAGLSIQTGVNTNQATVTLADVDGRTAVFRSPNATSPNCAQIGTTTNHDTAFLWGNAEQMRLTTTGLGIGTASPVERLTVVGNIRSTGNIVTGVLNANSFVRVSSSVTAGGSGFSELLFANATNISQGYLSYNHATDTLLIGTATTTKATLDASGNLGIGTASPGTRLDVSGVIRIRGGNSLTLQNAAADANATISANGGSGSNAMSFNSGAMTLDASGNWYLGTAALATTATAGFPWIPSCAGVPTGAPTAPYTNAAAMVVDTTNNRLYVRVGSTWRFAALT